MAGARLVVERLVDEVSERTYEALVTVLVIAGFIAYGWLCMFIGALCPSCPLIIFG